MSATIHGQTPAAHPNQKGVQSVLVVYWFRTSMSSPKRFMHAFTAIMRSKDARSRQPKSIAIKTIIRPELNAYSYHLARFIPLRMSSQ